MSHSSWSRVHRGLIMLAQPQVAVGEISLLWGVLGTGRRPLVWYTGMRHNEKSFVAPTDHLTNGFCSVIIKEYKDFKCKMRCRAQTKGFVPFVCAWHHILNLQKYNTIVFYRKFFGGSLSWCVILNKGALYVVQKKWIKMRNRPSLRDCAPHKQPSPNFLHSVVFVSPIGQLSNENIFCIMTLIKMQLTSRRTIPVHLNGRRVRRLKNGSKWSRLQSRVARLAFVTQTFVWGRIKKPRVESVNMQ